MRRTMLLTVATSVMLLSSCESKFSKLTKDAAKDTRDYIDAYNSATSAEEVRAIERDWKAKGDYYEQEFKKIDNETSIKEKQKFMQNEEYKNLGDEMKKARRDARNRFK